MRRRQAFSKLPPTDHFTVSGKLSPERFPQYFPHLPKKGKPRNPEEAGRAVRGKTCPKCMRHFDLPFVPHLHFIHCKG